MSEGRKPIQAFLAADDDPSVALTYETSLTANDEVIATLAGKRVWVRVLGPATYTGRARLRLEVLRPAPPAGTEGAGAS